MIAFCKCNRCCGTINRFRNENFAEIKLVHCIQRTQRRLIRNECRNSLVQLFVEARNVQLVNSFGIPKLCKCEHRFKPIMKCRNQRTSMPIAIRALKCQTIAANRTDFETNWTNRLGIRKRCCALSKFGFQGWIQFVSSGKSENMRQRSEEGNLIRPLDALHVIKATRTN